MGIGLVGLVELALACGFLVCLMQGYLLAAVCFFAGALLLTRVP